MEYEDREVIKQLGWKLYRSETDPVRRAAGLELVLLAHFERSVSCARVNGHRHPDWDAYASSWVHALGMRFAPRVLLVLCEKYRCPDVPLLPTGYTYYSDWIAAPKEEWLRADATGKESMRKMVEFRRSSQI